VASIQIIFLKKNGKSHSLSKDRMSMQIDIKNMSKINNVKQETFKIYEILWNTRRPHL